MYEKRLETKHKLLSWMDVCIQIDTNGIFKAWNLTPQKQNHVNLFGQQKYWLFRWTGDLTQCRRWHIPSVDAFSLGRDIVWHSTQRDNWPNLAALQIVGAELCCKFSDTYFMILRNSSKDLTKKWRSVAQLHKKTRHARHCKAASGFLLLSWWIYWTPWRSQPYTWLHFRTLLRSTAVANEWKWQQMLDTSKVTSSVRWSRFYAWPQA